MKPDNIIVVIDYNKQYLHYFFEELYEKANLFFLFYSYPHEVRSHSIEKYGKILFWIDFKDSFELITKVAPKKIVFFELETLNQVCLNVAAKNKKILSFFVDHGIQDYDISIKANNYTKEKKSSQKPKILKLLKYSPIDLLKNRLFFQKTTNQLPSKERAFLKQYKKVRLANTIFDTFKIIKSDYLLPSTFICFNPSNLNFYEQLYQKSLDNVKYIGFPEFDNYYFPTASADKLKWSDKEFVLFIDQPYVHFQYYGWTYDLKKDFLNSLHTLAKQQNKRLIIKKHPRETDFWIKVTEECKFLLTEDTTEILENISSVLGYNSTLLLPFAAANDIRIQILDNHPNSDDNIESHLVNSGVANYFRGDFSDSKYVEQQNKKKQHFIKDYLYKFDGKANERLNTILLS